MRIKVILIKLLILIITGHLSAQEYFEGQIDYKIDYKSMNENLPEILLSQVMGDSFTAYIREDRYVMIYNSKADLGWTKTIIRLDQGYRYIEYENSDTIYKSDLRQNQAKLIELRKDIEETKTVLGETCPSIKLKYESTDPNAIFKINDGIYYYSPKYKLNADLYKIYNSGFWNKYVELSKAISIRNEHIYEGFFKSISQAVKITESEISDSIFILNENKIIVEAE